MYCPMCGKPLRLVRRVTIDELNDAAMDEWASRNYEGEPKDVSSSDLSEHWSCSNKTCVSPPCYFNVHHPFKGYKSAPGDSWSISWIK